MKCSALRNVKRRRSRYEAKRANFDRGEATLHSRRLLHKRSVFLRGARFIEKSTCVSKCFFCLKRVKRCLSIGNCEQKVSIQLAISAMNIITGSNKMNEGDKNRLNLRMLKNISILYSKRVPLINKKATTWQNTKKKIIATTVKMIVLVLVNSKGSISRYAFTTNKKKSITQINQNIISYGFFNAK